MRGGARGAVAPIDAHLGKITVDIGCLHDRRHRVTLDHAGWRRHGDGGRSAGRSRRRIAVLYLSDDDHPFGVRAVPDERDPGHLCIGGEHRGRSTGPERFEHTGGRLLAARRQRVHAEGTRIPGIIRNGDDVDPGSDAQNTERAAGDRGSRRGELRRQFQSRQTGRGARGVPSVPEFGFGT